MIAAITARPSTGLAIPPDLEHHVHVIDMGVEISRRVRRGSAPQIANDSECMPKFAVGIVGFVRELTRRRMRGLHDLHELFELSLTRRFKAEIDR